MMVLPKCVASLLTVWSTVASAWPLESLLHILEADGLCNESLGLLQRRLGQPAHDATASLGALAEVAPSLLVTSRGQHGFSGCGPQQPPGVSDPVYRCTYDERTGQGIKISFHGEEVVCGGAWPLPVRRARAAPSVRFTEAQDDALYTLVLLNPDDVIPIAPVLHALMGNIHGSKLRRGHLEAAGNALGYIPPSVFFNNLIPLRQNYAYLVFRQVGEVDVRAWREAFGESGGGTRAAFPLEDFVRDNQLEFLASNYFSTAGYLRMLVERIHSVLA